MSIIQELESIKYRFVLDLIKSDEQYDKKRNVISGEEAFKLFLKRYGLMQNVLLPLKKKLGNRIYVTDINIVNSYEEETGILVKYIKDDKQYLISISNLDYEDINIVATDSRVQNTDFVEVNRSIILQTFRDISDNNLNDDILVKSTSGKFLIKDNCDIFNIKDLDGKVFSIDMKYSNYLKKDVSPSNLVCTYPKLKELLTNGVVISSILEHIHVYEDDFPKELTKKLTYR